MSIHEVRRVPVLFPVYRPVPEVVHGGIIGHQHVVSHVHDAHFHQQPYSPSHAGMNVAHDWQNGIHAPPGDHDLHPGINASHDWQNGIHAPPGDHDLVMELKIPPEVIAATFGDIANCHMSLASCVACYELDQERFLIRGESIEALEGAKKAIAATMAAAGYLLKVEGDQEIAPLHSEVGDHKAQHPAVPIYPPHQAPPHLGHVTGLVDDEEEEEEGAALGELGTLFTQIQELRSKTEMQEGMLAEAMAREAAFRAQSQQQHQHSMQTVALQLRAQKLAEERDAAVAERALAVADAGCMQAMLQDAGRFIEHLKKENHTLQKHLHAARQQTATYANAYAHASSEQQRAAAAAQAAALEAQRAMERDDEQGFSLASIKLAIEEAVAESKELGEDERKAKIKAMRLRWHPDKNPVLKEFATEVSKVLNEAVAAMEQELSSAKAREEAGGGGAAQEASAGAGAGGAGGVAGAGAGGVGGARWGGGGQGGGGGAGGGGGDSSEEDSAPYAYM